MASAIGVSKDVCSQWPAVHHSNTVTAEAQVPDPGCKCPMPKKVAISQERRDLGMLDCDAMHFAAFKLSYNALAIFVSRMMKVTALRNGRPGRASALTVVRQDLRAVQDH